MSSRTHAAKATIAALALAGLTVGGFGVTAAAADTGSSATPNSSGGLVCDLLPILCPSDTPTATATATVTETATTTATTTATATATATETATETATATATATETATATATSTVTTTATTTATTTVTATPDKTDTSTATATATGTATGTATATGSPKASAKPFTNITVSGLRVTKSKGHLVLAFTVNNTGTTTVGGVLVTAKASGYASKTWLVRLPVGLPVKVGASWHLHKRGKIKVSVKADPSNQLVESSEVDNTVSGTKVLR